MLVQADGEGSATASGAAVERTLRSRAPATLARTAERPFAAAPWLLGGMVRFPNSSVVIGIA